MFENTLEAIVIADDKEELKGIEYNFNLQWAEMKKRSGKEKANIIWIR